MKHILEVSHVTKDFFSPLSLSRMLKLDFGHPPATRALADVSFCLEKGSVLAVLGPNGAGKTTLLKIISTLILPDKGTVTVSGWRLGKDEGKIKQAVGLAAFQEKSFYWRLTGRQNLEFFAALYGLNKKQTQEKLCALFDIFEIGYQDKRFDSYSSGMKQKLALVRSLIHDPELLLLDEPMKSLDYAFSLKLASFIKDDLVAKQRKSVIYTTHRMDEAADFADIFLILHEGRILGSGTLAELRDKAGNRAASLSEIFVTMTKKGNHA